MFFQGLLPSRSLANIGIEKVLAYENQSSFYVGLIGGTGQGKSTLINAILKEPNLLPTHSLRACTAVVVEIAYNGSDDKSALYRAEVEFVEADGWQKELEVLFRDVDAHFEDSEFADIDEDLDRLSRIKEGLAMFKNVYPHLRSIDELRSTSVSKLMQYGNVRRVLGSTKNIRNANLNAFAKAIRPYIATNDLDNLDFWPMIKCVKVFVKAPILESGIVLVE